MRITPMMKMFSAARRRFPSRESRLVPIARAAALKREAKQSVVRTVAERVELLFSSRLCLAICRLRELVRTVAERVRLSKIPVRTVTVRAS